MLIQTIAALKAQKETATTAVVKVGCDTKTTSVELVSLSSEQQQQHYCHNN